MAKDKYTPGVKPVHRHENGKASETEASGPDHTQDHAHEQTHDRAHEGHGHHHDHKHHGHDHAHGHHAEHHHGHAHQRHHEHKHGDPLTGGTILTVRAASGLSGDIMLAGLAGIAGLQEKDLYSLVEELNLPPLKECITVEPRMVHQIAGVGCRIELPHEHAHRSLTDIRKIIADSAMPEKARELSLRAFTLLAEAEAAVHGKNTDDVTFHEVGALDSILDTCLVCRIFTLIAPARFVCGPLPMADGVISCAHGLVPSPAPAVLRLLEGVPVQGFSGSGETVTPTALSLLKALDAEFGPWPAMTVQKTVISYGSKVFDDAPNGAVWALGTLSCA